ncbi:hypothetical protein MBLNU13_g05044t1 [Cladosporium sp. NU13]
MAPPVGHTFRCEKSYQVPRASTSIAKGDAGVIDRISPDGTLVHITIHQRSGHKLAIPSVPLANLRVGPRFISDTTPLPVVLTGPLLDSIKPLPQTSSDIETEQNPFRRAVCYFLSGVRDNQERIPYLNQSHLNLISADQNIKTTANRFLQNVQHVNPRFLETFGKQNTTINMIIPTLQPTGTHDHDAGIYMVILDQFRKKTTRFRMDPHAYVGKSKDIGGRIQSHNASVNSNDADVQEVHRVMREAGRHRWFKLASHDANEGHSEQIGNAMRDIMETTFMMLFGTMSARVMVSRIRNHEDIAKDIAQNYDLQEMAKVFTDLSVAAFQKAGYYLPSSPNRTQAFGLHRYGCNVTIPLGGESANVYERTVWVRQDRGDQWSFHRSPLKFPKDKHIATMNYRDHEKGGSLQIQPTREEIAEMGIETGDEYRLIWEVRKPGKGTHPVAFVRLSEIGCWSNWSYANKVALKILFYSRKSRTWKTRYLQRQAQHHFVQNCVAPGAHADYSYGVGLYCFFMRCRFPAVQPWMAFFGHARIVTYDVDTFSQTIIVAHFNASADTGLVGPVFSPDVPRRQMELLGLQNVNASFRGFNWSWLQDPAKWKDGKVGAPNYAKSFRSRQKCDFCLFSANSVYSQIHSITNRCVQVPGHNICEPCAKMGRPCSWTDMPSLLGVDNWLEEVQKMEGGKKKGQIFSKGNLHKALVKGLISLRYASNALKTIEIDKATGNIITTEQQQQQVEAQGTISVDRSQLPAEQQAIFDTNVQRFTALIATIQGMDRTSNAYQSRMNEIAALVSSVSTRTDIPGMVRAALQSYITRQIRPFMVDGIMPS